MTSRRRKFRFNNLTADERRCTPIKADKNLDYNFKALVNIIFIESIFENNLMRKFIFAEIWFYRRVSAFIGGE
jgi:hypothetical protein